MRCRHSRKLAELQVGALGEPERLALERHVQDCAACQAEWAALERTARLLQPMPAHDAPARVRAHVLRQITPARQATRHVHWIPVVAAVMVVFIVALALVAPLTHGRLPSTGADGGYDGLQVAATWNTPLSDKAALGLALLAADEDDPLQGVQEALD